MRVVVLVPRREGFPDRDALWGWCRDWWASEVPEWPIIEGHHDIGLFNRSAAINRAAELAGEWDVAVIIDADVIVSAPNVREAVELADREGRLTVAFTERHNLSPVGSRKVMAGYTGNWKPLVARTFRDQHSACIAVPRRLYEAVGGFDEGFRGWGMEDTAFAIACELESGKLLRLPGECWHLHHVSPPGEKHGSPSHRANAARLDHYRVALALGDREAVRALVANGREGRDVVADGIPRILHRVVPERIIPVAEEWWARFGKLHPGWRLLTHREPLDSAEWPLTSRYWPRASCGAQLADIVRLEALIRFGGFYVDQDVEPFRSLDPLLGATVVAAWEDERTVPNAVLGARPDHPLIRQALDLAIRQMRRSVWDAGPGVTTRLFPGHPDVLLLPPGAFYDVHYQDPERDTKMGLPPSPWTFARHHYWGSWLPPERRRVPDGDGVLPHLPVERVERDGEPERSRLRPGADPARSLMAARAGR